MLEKQDDKNILRIIGSLRSRVLKELNTIMPRPKMIGVLLDDEFCQITKYDLTVTQGSKKPIVKIKITAKICIKDLCKKLKDELLFKSQQKDDKIKLPAKLKPSILEKYGSLIEIMSCLRKFVDNMGPPRYKIKEELRKFKKFLHTSHHDTEYESKKRDDVNNDEILVEINDVIRLFELLFFQINSDIKFGISRNTG